ncbi:MAG: TonB-dependent receptor domain-containing protein [Acidobacteriota bacterium]
MKSRLATGIAVIIFVISFSYLAYGQLVTQGTIMGTVEDETGARLPGVTVTLRSTALIREQVYVTSETGVFRAAALTPGVYEITLELEGFSTLVREGVIVSPKTTVSLTLTMRIAPITEVITVTGESPTVDTKSTTAKVDYTAEFLNSIPERRGTGSDILSITPGVTSYSVAGGSVSSISWQIDGVDTSDPDMGTQFPFINVDYLQETEVISWGAPPEFGKYSGGIFNVVTKSGGSEYHGEANFFYEHDSFIGSNVEKVQKDFPDFEITPYTLEKFYDFSFNIGGPIIRNKIHFFASYFRRFYDRTESGNVEVSTDHSQRGVEKISMQLGDKDRVMGALMFDEYPVTGRAPAGTQDPNAYCEEPSWTKNPMATWQHIFSPNSLLEVRYMGYYGYYDLVPRNNLPCIVALEDWSISQSYYYYMHNGRGSSEVKADYSYYAEEWAGTHDFKVGVHYQDAYMHTILKYGLDEFGQPAYYYSWGGEIVEARLRDWYDETWANRILTLYAQDAWTIKDRLTLNYGLRLDKTTGGLRGGNDWIHYTDIAPRIGASYDLTGDGKTLLKASWGRYYEAPHCSTYSFKDMPPTYYAEVLAPGVYDIYAVDDPASTLNIDENLKNHYAEMMNIGLERELFPDVSLTVRYNHRIDKQIFGGENRLAEWAPFYVVDSEFGQTHEMYYQTNVGEDDRWLINNDRLQMKYDGVDIMLNKRYSNNWQLAAALTWQVSKGNYDMGYEAGGWGEGAVYLGDEPNDFVNAEGIAGGRRSPHPIIFRLQGSYRLPEPIDAMFGWTYEYVAGYYDTTYERFWAPNDRRYSILIEERGNYQHDNRNILDLRFEKRFKLPGSLGGIKEAGELGIIADIFNVLNQAPITRRWMGVGSSYLNPRYVWSPREFRLGVRWIF